MKKRISVYLSTACNNNCLYCYQLKAKSSSVDIEKIIKQIHDLKKQGFSKIEFNGGEPTLLNELPEIVQLAKKLNFSGISLSTNGRRFCYKKYSDLLINAGLTTICVSFPAHTKYLFSEITRSKDSYDQTIDGLKNLSSYNNITLEAVVPVTRYNYQFLSQIVKRLLSFNVKLIGFQYLLPLDLFGILNNGSKNISDAIVGYHDTIPFVEDALKKYEKKVRLYVDYIPLCLAGNFKKKVLSEIIDPQCYDMIESGEIIQTKAVFGQGFVKTLECAACVDKKKCIGFPFIFFDKYGVKNKIKNAGDDSVMLSLDIKYGPCDYKCVFCTRFCNNRIIYEQEYEETINLSLDYMQTLFRHHRKMHGLQNVHIFGRERVDVMDKTIEIVKLAKKEGFQNITLWSSGLRYSDNKHVHALVEAGVSSFKLPIYGYNADIHEGITGVKGSFNLLKKSIKNLIKMNIDFKLHAILLKKNIDFLHCLCDLVIKEFNRIELEIRLYSEEGEYNQKLENVYEQNIVSFSEIIERLKGFKFPLKLNLMHFPFCIAEKLRFYFHDVYVYPLENDWLASFNIQKIQYKQIDERKESVFTEKCANCLYKPSCFGITKGYHRLFGDTDLNPKIFLKR